MTRYLRLFVALSVLVSSGGLSYAQNRPSQRLQFDISTEQRSSSLEGEYQKNKLEEEREREQLEKEAEKIGIPKEKNKAEKGEFDIVVEQKKPLPEDKPRAKEEKREQVDRAVKKTEIPKKETAAKVEKGEFDIIVVEQTEDELDELAGEKEEKHKQAGKKVKKIALTKKETQPKTEKGEFDIVIDQKSSSREEKLVERAREKEEKREQAAEKTKKTEPIEKETKTPKDKNDVRIIELSEIKFSQSDILPQSLFATIKERYENTLVSINDIYSIVKMINNEYMLKGYISSQAYLSEQDITGGVLFVNLVEGIVDKVNITGNNTTNESYIKRCIKFDRIGDNLNAIETNKQIMRFNAENDAKARVVLSPGKVFGTSDVDLIIDEPNWYSLNVFCDNAGQKETGEYRGGIFGTVRSLTGYRDILNLGGVFSEGSKAVFVSYEIPEPLFGTRVGAGFDYSDTEIVNGVLKTLEVKGDYYSAYLYAKKPFYIRENTVSNATFNVLTKKGKSSITKYITQNTKTDVLSLNADNSYMTSFGYIYNALAYSQGLKLIEGETNFEKISYYGEFYAGFLNYFGFNLKVRGQAAFDTVPSSEQLSIGGANSVRGYSEGMLMSKDGLNANAEVQYNLNFIKWQYFNFAKIFLFGDYGIVYPDSNANWPDDYENSIYSIGVGLKFGMFKYLEAGITWAFPLGSHDYYEVPGNKILFVVTGKI